MERKELGKIKEIKVELPTPSAAMLQVRIEIGGRGWGTTLLLSTDEAAKHIRSADKMSVDQLLNLPVQATVEDNSVTHWRILTEVL